MAPLINKRVEVVGSERKDLNGLRGMAVSFDHAMGRYMVKIDGNSAPTGVRPKHLKDVMAAKAAAGQTETKVANGAFGAGGTAAQPVESVLGAREEEREEKEAAQVKERCLGGRELHVTHLP